MQGLNRQIRRMCEYFGYKVVNLKRLRVINIRLGNLRPGEYRHLTKEEETELRRLVERKEEVKTKREEAQPDNKNEQNDVGNKRYVSWKRETGSKN